MATAPIFEEGVNRAEEGCEIEALGLERDVLASLAREDASLHRPVTQADNCAAPTQDPRRRDRGDDSETEAPVCVGDTVLDPESVDHAILRMSRIRGGGRCRGSRRSGPPAARGLLRPLFVVRRAAGALVRQPIRGNVRVDEGRVDDLSFQVEDASIGRDGRLARRPGRLDDAAAHDDHAILDNAARRGDHARARQGVGEAVSAADFRRATTQR
jgi:hypothetical protein